MLTEFGKMLRKLRIEREETMADMAKKLNITSAYLSAIELGKRPAPVSLVPNIVDIYALSEDQGQELQDLAYEAAPEVKVPMQNASESERKITLSIIKGKAKNLPKYKVDQILQLMEA